MTYATRADNVYLIDTKMFGFDLFNSAYIITGAEVALIDTGAPTSWEALLDGMSAHGFGPNDVGHIFVTHAEHPDHSGNVGALLKENGRAMVYVSAVGAECLTHPAIEAEHRRRNLAPNMAARFGEMDPVPSSKLTLVADGDAVDLGRGVKLKVILTPGHQPSGFVLFEERNRGLFINDLCGAYFPDAGASWVFTPYRSDVRQAMASLQKVRKLPVERLFLGHYGISDHPKEILDWALVRMQALLDIGAHCARRNKPEEIELRVMAKLLPEVEKIGKVRDAGLYEYLRDELAPSMAQAFANYYELTA
ncbi:MAG: MBL fold metallo-hydrolase [Actinobacteria bacterium]|nr:MBL fold metallo-hydrolase [Actinomycetota bacterium]